MAYKERLASNNADLQTILGKINALPDAGGSTPTPEAVEQATPSITVSASGLITAKAIQAAGYVAGGTKSATKQLTTKGAATITPGTEVKTAVSAGTYVTGDIKVAAVQSSGTEICSVELHNPSTFSVWYTSSDGELINVMDSELSLRVIKGTLMSTYYDIGVQTSGSVEEFAPVDIDGTPGVLLLVNGDGAVTIE